MLNLLYNTLLRIAAPGVAIYLRSVPRHRVLLDRFYPKSTQIPPCTGDERLWIHAASLGEVNTAAPFVKALKAMRPNAEILLTVSTATGKEQARRIKGPDAIAWCPFDHPSSVERFYTQSRPSMLILTETEIWPNLLAAAHERETPVVIVNARISEKHFARYKRIRGLVRPVLVQVSLVCAQTALDAERFAELGVPQEHIHVVGSSKFDGARRTADAARTERIEELYKLTQEKPVLTFGSTRPGDERIAIDALRTLQSKGINIRLIIVPRHVERVSAILAEHSDIDFLVHSQQTNSTANRYTEDSVILVDTTGELTDFYAVSDLAVVGGSFSEDVQGHNPIEPAALGIPAVFGPCMKNFLNPAAQLTASGAALQVSGPDSLLDAVTSLITGREKLQHMSDAARKTVDQNSGAVTKTMELIQLGPGSHSGT